MKRLLMFLMVVVLSGCVTTNTTPPPTSKPPEQVNKDTSSIDIDKEKTAGVGDVFFKQEHVKGYFSVYSGLVCQDCSRFDLTIVELNDRTIGLQYSEYFMAKGGSWLIKQGFNKTFTYSPKETIRFKGYEFEPVSLVNGQLTYKRTK